jgi:hypothetical protein
VATWVRFLGWLDIGILIYWFYGRTHSPLADQGELAARGLTGRVGNAVTMLGAVVTFNGVFMTALGFMTELGITTEELAKWHEIGVTPHQADTIGLLILAAGVVLFVVGRMVARTDPAEAGTGVR